jgi:hypothetical protein
MPLHRIGIAEHMKAIRTIDDWADAIAALPGNGPLTRRVVVVPNERVAHALRRRLLERERHASLAGTLFANLSTLAQEILVCAGVRFRTGEEGLRVARVGGLLKHPPPLRYFDPEVLRTTPGWDDAFARSITELEATGLSPAQLASRGAAAADVAAIWTELRKQAGESWSSPHLQAEAAACLERDPGRWRLGAVTLAAVTGHESLMHVRLLRAIPNVQIVPIVARPIRDAHMQRVDQLYGEAACYMLTEAHVPDAVLSERDRLAARFFEPPGGGSAPARPTGARDGTAELEEYAGLEAEIEAAVEWVAREVLEYGTPLGELALLMPWADPYVDLLVERLSGLPWPATDDGELPVFVANGTLSSAKADGARWLALVRALDDNLCLDSLAALIPALRTEGDARLTRGAALQLLQVLGTVGGSPAHPEGALEWMPRAERRAVAFVQEMQRPPDGVDEASGVYEREAAERMARELAAIRPALAGLCGVAELVVRGAGLRELWAALSAFAEAHLRTLQGARTLARLRAAIAPLCADSTTVSKAGHEALAVFEGLLVDLRQRVGRYGEARVYVGTVSSAVGLPFTSVRVLGLSEGRIPSTPREDPVLPDALRVALDALLPTTADRLRFQLHALDRVVRGAAKRIVFSSPRLGPERSHREPSAVFVEAALAIGRSPGAPSHAALEEDYFRPARGALREYRLREPVLRSAGLERAALLGASDADVHDESSAFSQRRMRRLLAAAQAGPLDGLLGRDVLRGLLPGLSADRPISASKLKELLECPHRFLLQQLLGFKAPPGVPATTELDSLTYGKLMHRVVESFSNEHGAGFGARKHDLLHFGPRQRRSRSLSSTPWSSATRSAVAR